MKPNQVKKAADAMAALYVWDCVTSILEGGASPDRLGRREHRDVLRVIKIANAAKQRMLIAYDNAVAESARAAKEE